MAQIQGSIVERPGQAVPADLANKIAIIAWYPNLTVSPAQIQYAQRLGDVAALGLYGKGADLGAFALREADERGNPATVYFVPVNASTIGSITDNGSTGFGPTQTMTNDGHGHPYDDAIVKIRIQDSGIPGVGTFELSTAYSVTRDATGSNPSINPLWEPARTIPPETSAYMTGASVTALVYAKPAIVTGTIDIVASTTLYGAGGTLAGTEFDFYVDGNAPVTVTFGTGVDAPSSYSSVVSTINSAMSGNASASVTNEGKLRLTGVSLSTAGSIALDAGSPGDALALLGLTDATYANVVGTVDLTVFDFNSGIALDGLTVIIDEDTTTAQTCTFSNAVTNTTELLAELTAAISTNITWSLVSGRYLVATSDTIGTASTIALGAGTAHTALFGTPTITSPGTGTTNGTAGVLDGRTVIYEGDATSGPQTWTIPSGGSAISNYNSLISAADALTGVEAMLFSSANLFRIGSETVGAGSTFEITGGTALALLGLSIGSAAGAASEFVIEHLGVKVTFPQGTYTSGYERTWTLKAPACSISDVQSAIDEMVAQDIHVGRIVCPSNVSIGNVGAFIQGAASKIGILESANDAQFAHFAFGAPITESDADVKTAQVSGVAGVVSVGRRVDMAARSEYVRPARSSPNNTGSLLRSALWSLTGRYASLPLGSDVGQHNIGAVPYVDYAPVDEDKATTKLSASRLDTSDPRAMTLQKWADGLYFTAGYTSAPSASAYADQYVRDITLRVAQLIHSAMKPFLNDPTLATDPATGKLTDKGAGTIATNGLAVLAPLIAPDNATEEERRRYLLTRARVVANRDEVIAGPSGTQRLKVDVIFSVNGVARDIRITVGAGLISTEG